MRTLQSALVYTRTSIRLVLIVQAPSLVFRHSTSALNEVFSPAQKKLTTVTTGTACAAHQISLRTASKNSTIRSMLGIYTIKPVNKSQSYNPKTGLSPQVTLSQRVIFLINPYRFY